MGKQSRFRRDRRERAEVNRQRRNQIIPVFQEVAPDIFADEWPITQERQPGACLNATRVTIEVMKHFEVDIRPLAVTVTAFNRPFWNKVVEHERMPKSEAECEAWCDEGGWAVGIGDVRGPADLDMRTGDWSFHLVAATDKLMFDMSAGQMSRPSKGLFVPPSIIVPITPAFLAGLAPLPMENGTDGAVINYGAIPTETGYKHISGFQPHGYNMALAFRVIKAMHAKLGFGA